MLRRQIVVVAALLCLSCFARTCCCTSKLSTKISEAIDHRLGVLKIQMYVKVPVYVNKVPQNRTATAVATVWLRRLGGGQAGRYALPHQKPDSIRGVMWLDDPNNFKLSGPTSHAAMPVHHQQWEPRLVLDTLAGGKPVKAVLESLRRKAWDTRIRPFSFLFWLPAKAGDCFKIREASTPNFATPLCLHHHTRLCPTLVPPERHSDTRPALWAVFGPVRNLRADPGPGWLQTAHATAVYMMWYLTYHLAAGVSGVLLYGSPLDVGLLQQVHLLQPFLRSGALRLLVWDLPERAEKYNYDQALYLNHALLGLSACGTDLRLLVGDFDEYLLLPRGKPWPDPLPCMSRPGANLTSDVVVNRRNGQASSVPPDEEPAHWLDLAALKTTLLRGDLSRHAARPYDMLADRVFPTQHAKRIVAPAAPIAGYFVHEGMALRGAAFTSPLDCLSILHVSNMMRARSPAFADANATNHHLANWVVAKRRARPARAKYLAQQQRGARGWGAGAKPLPPAAAAGRVR